MTLSALINNLVDRIRHIGALRSNARFCMPPSRRVSSRRSVSQKTTPRVTTFRATTPCTPDASGTPAECDHFTIQCCDNRCRDHRCRDHRSRGNQQSSNACNHNTHNNSEPEGIGEVSPYALRLRTIRHIANDNIVQSDTMCRTTAQSTHTQVGTRHMRSASTYTNDTVIASHNIGSYSPPQPPVMLSPLLACDPQTDEDVLWYIAQYAPDLRQWLVANPNASAELLEYVAQSGGPGVNRALTILLSDNTQPASDDTQPP